MRLRSFFLLFLSASLLLILGNSCNHAARSHPITDSTDIHLAGNSVKWMPDTTKFFVIDTTGFGKVYDAYDRVKNLLHFHTKDTMRTDSTYVATLYMGKNISSAELDMKVKDIVETGGKVKVVDTTQEISMYMTAALEDKAPSTDRNFSIELIGGVSNIRKYDEKKNKMVWQWNVTPRKAGNHDLILSISNVTSDGTELGSPETHRHSITIFASRHKESIGKGIGNFFAKYWQWLLGVVALPVFLAWFTTKRRNAARESELKEHKEKAKPFNSTWRKKKGQR